MIDTDTWRAFLKEGTTIDSVQPTGIFSSFHTLENTGISSFMMSHLASLNPAGRKPFVSGVLWHLRGVSAWQTSASLGGSKYSDHWMLRSTGVTAVGPGAQQNEAYTKQRLGKRTNNMTSRGEFGVNWLAVPTGTVSCEVIQYVKELTWSQ